MQIWAESGKSALPICNYSQILYQFLTFTQNLKRSLKKTGVFHVCPLLENYAEGPLHIKVRGVKDTSGTAICEQLKLIDPSARSCKRIDRVPYHMIMNVSDAIQGIFEYD